MKKYLLFILILPLLSIAQKHKTEGILFEKNITLEKWNSIFDKAKEGKKYIFLYCKYVNSSLASDYDSQFFNDSTIEFFNQNFYCLELPIKWNKAEDSKSIASFLTELYKIKSLPTFIIFRWDGKLLHRFSAKTFWFSKDSILSSAKNLFSEEKQYFFLVDKFEKGCNDVEFYNKLFNAVYIADCSTDDYVERFIKTRVNLFTRENAEILISSHSYNTALDCLFNNHDKWKKIIDSNILQNYYQEKIYSKVQEFGRGYYYAIGGDSLINYFEKKYFSYGKLAAVKFFIHQRYDSENENFIERLMNKHLDSTILNNLSLWDYNSFAWKIFSKTNDTTFLKQALSWSKICIDKEQKPEYLDTYANLLYKLGRKDEAIEYEEKAVALLTDNAEKKSYLDVLKKMKRNKPLK